MRKLSVVLAVLMIAFSASAERVSYKDAEKAAKAYYHQTVNAFRATAWNDINLTCVVNPNEKDAKYNLYIFDVNENEGFVVVSSDNQISPVLAYSFECPFNIDNMSPGQAAYMRHYSAANDYAQKNVTEFAATMQAEWADLLAYRPNMRATREVTTSPVLLEGIVWEQGWPFNCKCPEKSGGNSSMHGHAPVGCVATATCHVMKYWNWPATGQGSYTHSNTANGHCGNITINFANQTYDWSAMPDDPSASENEEVGKICFHVGVGVKMSWGADGSGTQTFLIPSALKNYFKYSSDVAYKSKATVSDANWRTMIIGQIDQKYPIIYSGTSYAAGAGHAWNCDGYQINGSEYKFHMVWGWGAYGGNGFYTLDHLISTATAGGDENDFSDGQEIVYGIHPNTSFSACENMTITGSEGTFDDGSRANNYAPNKDCTYTINPECGSYVLAKFTKFDLAEGDYVNVFEGDANSTDLLATFDKDNRPTGNITTVEGALTFKFHTDGSSEADGWKVDYKTYYCKDAAIVTLTKPSGTISDGSESCKYANNVVCQWMIAPENTQSVTITFSEFNVANDTKDYVGIYRNEFGNNNLVAKFKSDNLPTEPITVAASSVGIKFYTNTDIVGDGWKLNYVSSTNGIDEIDILSNLSVVPNPANNESRIAFTLTEGSSAKVTITNIMGQIVASNEYDLESGYHEIPVSEMQNVNLRSGIYFVTLQSGNQIKTCKFMFAE